MTMILFQSMIIKDFNNVDSSAGGHIRNCVCMCACVCLYIINYDSCMFPILNWNSYHTTQWINAIFECNCWIKLYICLIHGILSEHLKEQEDKLSYTCKWQESVQLWTRQDLSSVHASEFLRLQSCFISPSLLYSHN